MELVLNMAQQLTNRKDAASRTLFRVQPEHGMNLLGVSPTRSHSARGLGLADEMCRHFPSSGA